jgi:hypothetical protein
MNFLGLTLGFIVIFKIYTDDSSQKYEPKQVASNNIAKPMRS